MILKSLLTQLSNSLNRRAWFQIVSLLSLCKKKKKNHNVYNKLKLRDGLVASAKRKSNVTYSLQLGRNVWMYICYLTHPNIQLEPKFPFTDILMLLVALTLECELNGMHGHCKGFIISLSVSEIIQFQS